MSNTSPLRLRGDDDNDVVPFFQKEEKRDDDSDKIIDKTNYKSIMTKLQGLGRHTTPFLHPSGGQSRLIPAKCVYVNDCNSIWVAFPMFGSAELTSIIKLRLEGIKTSTSEKYKIAKQWLKDKVEQKIILVRLHPGFERRHKPLKDDAFVGTIFAYDSDKKYSEYQNFVARQTTSFMGSINQEMITYNHAEPYTHPNPHEVFKAKREKKKKLEKQ